MISHEYKCIFIHIPKCAGTSIETALGHFDGHVGRSGQDHRTIRRLEAPFLKPQTLSSSENIMEALRRIRHHFRTPANPRNKYTVTRTQYEAYFKFTIVRNPWARVFSWYRGVIEDELHRKELKIDDDISFHDFLVRFAGKGMLRPQTYWLKNAEGLIPLDYIGRFENLSEDFQACCLKMGIEHINLPRKNMNVKKDHRDHFDEKLKNLVQDVYREEIELFEYQF